jgi:hypothetical protein
MSKQTINNGDTGLSTRTKLNDNFTELYKGDNIDQASAGSPGGNDLFSFYDKVGNLLKKITFTNFFLGLKSAFDNIYGSKSVQDSLVLNTSKCIAVSPGFNGLIATVNIPHGLSGTPTFYSITFTNGSSPDPNLDKFSLSADATNVIVVFELPPAALAKPTKIMLSVKL